MLLNSLLKVIKVSKIKSNRIIIDIEKSDEERNNLWLLCLILFDTAGNHKYKIVFSLLQDIENSMWLKDIYKNSSKRTIKSIFWLIIRVIFDDFFFSMWDIQ